MKQNLRSGPIVPIITPYRQHEIFSVIDHLKKGGITSIFLFGTTGEALQLPHQDKLKLMREVAEYVKDDMQLLIGISSPRMEESIELMQAAEETSAAASVILPLIISDDVQHVIHTLLQNGRGKIFLYNLPKLTRDKSIPVADIYPLLSEERILGIKDSSANMDYFKQLMTCRERNPDFKMYYGSEDGLRAAMPLGIDGFVPGSGNFAPQLAARLWQERENGPWDEWEAIRRTIRSHDSNFIFGLKKLMQQEKIISDERHY